MSLFFYGVGFGVVIAAIIALSSVALSLQWSVTNVPNFAHGELLTVGAYGALIAQYWTSNLIVDALAAVCLGAIVALLTYLIVVAPFLRARVNITTVFVVTIGASIVLQNGLGAIFGGTTETYKTSPGNLVHVGPFLWTGTEIATIIVAIGLVAALSAVMKFSDFGRRVRAVADNRALAEASGVNTARLLTSAWLLAGGIAGLAGFALALESGSFSTVLGFNFLLVTFAASVAGGLGKPYGALVGALVVGIVMEVGGTYVLQSYKEVFALAILIAFLLVRPSGLFRPFGAVQ